MDACTYLEDVHGNEEPWQLGWSMKVKLCVAMGQELLLKYRLFCLGRSGFKIC